MGSVRHGKKLQPARRIVKTLLSILFPIVKFTFKFPEVKSIEETLDKIIENRSSISRFGDGEFLYIIDKLNLPFQKYDPILAEKLKKILVLNDPDFLVGLPIGYHSMSELNDEGIRFWRSQITWIYPRLKKYLDLKKIYYNAHITRVYITIVDKNRSRVYFSKLMKIWEGRKVVIIEGEKSRLGMGNDLFSRTKSIERILAPMHHAFDKYNDLLKFAKTLDKSKLILIALGPAATALAYDLYLLGFQAVDIGNVDIEYEWFMIGAKSKVRIPYKYTSEAAGGRKVEDVNDKKYLSEIIAKFF